MPPETANINSTFRLGRVSGGRRSKEEGEKERDANGGVCPGRGRESKGEEKDFFLGEHRGALRS